MNRRAEGERPTLRGMKLERHLEDPAIRQRFVTRMFDIIAPRYDRFTRVFSFGMDRRWKASLLDALARHARPGAAILDLACGTGDLAVESAERVPESRVLGIDASARMIAAAEDRLRRQPRSAERVRYIVGDMMALPAPDASADVVLVGYGLRNVPDARVAIAEIARVLRPGGLLLALDFYRPRSAIWRALFLGHLRVAGNLVGWLWHREPAVYGYIAPSIARWVSWRVLSTLLRAEGFSVVQERPWLHGGICLHVAVHGRRPD